MNLTRYAKPLAIVLLIAALVIVIAQNRAPVQTHFLLVTIEMPQILLLALTAVGGFAVGLLVPALVRPRRRWPRRNAASSGYEEPGEQRHA